MDTFQTFLNACRNGQKNIVKLLLERGGIELNRRDARVTRRSTTSAVKDTAIWSCCCWKREPMPRP